TSSVVSATNVSSHHQQLPKVEHLSGQSKPRPCKTVEPPLFGNYQQTSARSQKNASSSRHNLGVCGRWPSIPAGADVCLKASSKRSLPQYQATQFMPLHHHQQNELLGDSSGKKAYFNLMWDPHVVRGPNLVQFSIMQRAKCEAALDLSKNMIFRDRLRRNFLDRGHSSKSKKGQGTIYPTVKIDKEPLSYQSFIPFLTDPLEITRKDAAQSMHDDWPSCCTARLPEPTNKFSEGVHKSLQTETTACKQDTTKWILDNLLEKIPEQAILEVAEETELETVRGERQRHEMVLLYTKWQKLKENQWHDYLQAWNEMRMQEIAEEDAHLQDRGDGSICAVTFAKNAIKCCFKQTFEVMKQDRYLSKEGVPFGELKAVEKIMENRKKAREACEQQQLAKCIVDSAIVKSVVTRFAEHMDDDFGRPHGRWLSTAAGGRSDPDVAADDHHLHLPVEYDLNLKTYLEGRNKLRRESIRGTVGVRSDTSLFNIFDKNLRDQGAKGGRLISENPSEDLPRLTRLFEPRMKSISFGNTLGVEQPDEGKSRENSFDVTLVYRRKTSWSKLERNDDNQRKNEGEEEAKDKRESGASRLSGDKTQRRSSQKDDDDNSFGGVVKVEIEDTDKLNEGEEKRGSDA
ncbi:hypothetical protein Ocin01_13607, partial [Orchesella cincta]